ncbi:signal recognition particle receptor subunit beta-like isoform X5 [Adelges cooleyi]|uniref:signal recognition particle receptor subunit beta-like isoform X1 n=1 Tax=Adelges cooleyi TaxID=133065 RepID=UPI0021803A8C|nr:signal recognition particle receptor subunit beta-like isoform X1 [Adelges cooleyi]XP_050431486.1 signal recognition particle receptor subunit beta-like isoform X3 [Adelges cooleyi]XP_050431487.1 signal recognition particle receptor subunit beta-like isoform X4 [Adelges cooleyi]XP_050431489.1 signal recognition particle receptor subunit beta-like isoform X5 [Adelges cooleyi]
MSVNASKVPEDDNFLTKELFVSLAVLFVTLVLLYLWKKSNKTYRDVLLVGLCDSGKTALYSHLLFNKAVQTFTSQVENIGEFKNSKKSLRVVDIPGHERAFGKFWDVYKTSCKGIIFVVDSENVQTSVCDVADLLYRVITDDTIVSNKSKILVVCNKQDKLMAKGSEVIKTLLEKELDTLRITKANQLESIDGKKNNKTSLGKKKKSFEFSHCQIPVEFAESSLSASQDVVLEPVKNWLDKIQ